jgi:hypothetical protein
LMCILLSISLIHVLYIYAMMSVKLIMVKSNTKLGMNCVTFFLFFICSVCGDLFSLVLTMEFSYKKVIREKIVIINLGSFLGQVQECIVHFFICLVVERNWGYWKWIEWKKKSIENHVVLVLFI